MAEGEDGRVEKEEVCPEPLEIDEERKVAIFWDKKHATDYAVCLMKKDGKYHAVREETVPFVPGMVPLPPLMVKEFMKLRPPVQYVVSLRGIERERLLKMLRKAKEARK